MDNKPKPYADLKAKVRTYTDKEGKEKGVYVKVGTLFATPHGSNMYITMEALPISKEWNGIVNVFVRDDADHEIGVTDTKQNTSTNDNSPINLDDIPF
jgi:ribosome biogenesis protein Nip4